MMRNVMVMLGMGMLLACLAQPALAKTYAVTIKNGKCIPAKLTITAGDTVEFTNDDNKDHRIQANDGVFDSGKLKPGESYKVKLSKPGTYAYACALHPREKGTVIVKKK